MSDLMPNAEFLPISVAKRVDTSLNPRFLGIPSQDQIHEAGSTEGLFGGLSVQDVVSRDTEQLQASGVSWEEGISTLKRIASALRFLEKQVQGTDLPGFPGVAYGYTGARFQFSQLIDSTLVQGDGNIQDILCSDSQEAKITYEPENGEHLQLVVNPQTLYLAEAHHLLEKGNQYAMTGSQLAILTKLFHEQSFIPVQEWINNQPHIEGAVVGHREEVIYSDGSRTDLQIGRSGILSLHPPQTKDRYFSVKIKPDQKQVQSITIERTREGSELADQDVVEIFFKDGNPEGVIFYGGYDQLDPIVLRNIEDLSDLRLGNYINLAHELLRRSVSQTGGLLNGLEMALHELPREEISGVGDLIEEKNKASD